MQRFQIGLLAGQLGTLPDFLAPMDEPDLEAWEQAGHIQKPTLLLLPPAGEGRDEGESRKHQPAP